MTTILEQIQQMQTATQPPAQTKQGSKSGLMIGGVSMITIGVIALAILKNKPKKPQAEAVKTENLDEAEAEKRRIMREMAARGGKKSKRGKAEKNGVPAQSILRHDGNGQDVDNEADRQPASQA